MKEDEEDEEEDKREYGRIMDDCHAFSSQIHFSKKSGFRPTDQRTDGRRDKAAHKDASKNSNSISGSPQKMPPTVSKHTVSKVYTIKCE